MRHEGVKIGAWEKRSDLPILFVDNGMAASCLKVQQMALVNVM